MVDVTDATFETDILERSEQVTVVVDLWAPWCGPCKTLGPILEKVVADAAPDVELVKVDTDQNPVLSQMFKVQGIPAVYAVRDRKVLSGFVGAQPEAQVRAFVDGVRPSEADKELAGWLADGSEEALEKVLVQVPGHPEATVALAERYVADGRTEDALAVLAKVPETAETRRVAALARTGADVDGSPEGGPLADVEPKLDALLERVKDDEEARQEFLDLLELMGPDDPRTAPYRKALTQRLY